MRIKIVSSIILLITFIAIYEYYQNKYNIKKSVETVKGVEFKVERSFDSVRKSLIEGKFEEEILKINNAIIISKEWTNKKLYLERPLRRNRYWEFDGTMIAKVRINEENVGVEEVEMKHNIEVRDKSITINASLDSPIKKIGLTKLDQNITIEESDKSVLVKSCVAMKVQRLIPIFMEKYAQEQLDKAAENYLQKIENAIKGLPEPRSGISIPLN